MIWSLKFSFLSRHESIFSMWFLALLPIVHFLTGMKAIVFYPEEHFFRMKLRILRTATCLFEKPEITNKVLI